MLADAVKTLKGERVRDMETAPSVDLPVEAVIPADYVPGESHRIALYRRLADVQSEEELAGLREEMVDRYGELPAPVENLAQLAALKLKAMDAGVADIAVQDGRIVVRMAEGSRLGPREQRVLEGLFRPSVRQARAGARSALPRAMFSQMQVSFGYDRKRKDEMLAAVDMLLTVLIRRAEGRPSVSGDAEKAVAEPGQKVPLDGR
jgi:transcription-repair coupling factor (superfamily II helicase)